MPESDEGQVKKEQEEEEGEQSKKVCLFVRRNPIDPRTIMTPDPLFAAMPGQRSGYRYNTVRLALGVIRRMNLLILITYRSRRSP